MSTEKNKILFVDFNGVLSYKPFWFSLAQQDPVTFSIIQEYLFETKLDLVKAWMVGQHTSEEILQKLCDDTRLNYEYIWDTFVQDCINLDVSDRILPKLKDLKDEYYLVLSTGNMDCFNRWTLQNNPLMSEVFDRIDNSYDLGYQKNHNAGAYFKDRIKEYGLTPRQAFVIDDSSKVCRVFQDIGGKAFCATGENNVLEVLHGI